uniref:Palmitoyltransferase n=1 Tax=Monodon monoceros TaxID=40151 RepID=A0A8C6CAT9_MONMO
MGQPWAVGSAEAASARLRLGPGTGLRAGAGSRAAPAGTLGPDLAACAGSLPAAQPTGQRGGLFLRSDPSIQAVMLAGRGQGQAWAYCYQCQSRRPPRSGHYSAWRRCILRRDHHGRPPGRRVRFRNYRPCVCLLLHAAGVLLHVCALPGPDPSALLRAHTPLHTTALLPLPRRQCLRRRSRWPSLVLDACFRQLQPHPVQGLGPAALPLSVTPEHSEGSGRGLLGLPSCPFARLIKCPLGSLTPPIFVGFWTFTVARAAVFGSSDCQANGH